MSPAFQFYPADWLADENVSLMTMEEEGAYIRSLCYCWREGSIPSDPDKLARLLGKGGSTTLATVVQRCFVISPNDGSRMLHMKLESERSKQAAWKEKSAAGGKRSGVARRKALKTLSQIDAPKIEGWFKGGSRVVEPNGNSSSSSLFSSLSSFKTPVDGVNDLPGMCSDNPVEELSDHAILISQWTIGFESFFGRKYAFTGGKDGAAVKGLLKIGSPAQVMVIAKRAWAAADKFYCKHSTTLTGLRSQWNGILAELDGNKSKPVYKEDQF